MSFRTKQSVEAAARPVDYREARRFQLTVVLWVVLSLALIGGAILLMVCSDVGLPFGVEWFVAGWLIAVIGEKVDFTGLFYVGALVAVFGVGALAVTPVTLWRVALMVARKAAQRESPGLWTLALGLPVCWLGLAALWLVVVPGLLGWSALMIYSLGL